MPASGERLTGDDEGKRSAGKDSGALDGRGKSLSVRTGRALMREAPARDAEGTEAERLPPWFGVRNERRYSM